jgi:signal transduction histidine kinase
VTACDELTVTGDRHRLRQLLLNLSDNAIKYNQRKGTVTLSLRRAAGNAEVAIANTGRGIPAETLPRVFDPFFRADASHSQTVEGCGLGLSIARWIVTAHGGYHSNHLRAESAHHSHCAPATSSWSVSLASAPREMSLTPIPSLPDPIRR